MIFSEVDLQRVIIGVVLMLSRSIPTVTDVTPFMLIPTVFVELVITVEALSTKAAFWVSLKSTLFCTAWLVVAELLMPS
jgi:hypothetical protein